MLWKTHIRIINEVLYSLRVPLSSVEASNLRDGVIAPDQWRDYPHHYGKSDAIKKHFMVSRQCYLQDDLPLAYYYLGVALHYIQDSYTSVISYDSPNNQIWHQNYEQDIEDSQFVHRCGKHNSVFLSQ